MSDICVIFDLDGTLVDSESLNCRGFIDLIPEIDEPIAALARRYRGVRLADILGDISRRYDVHLDEAFAGFYREYVAALYDSHLTENPGVSRLLGRLPYRLCVASSAPLSKIVHALEVTGLSGYFDGSLFSAYEINHWKPSPRLFLHAASRMEFEPSHCVVVEDSPSGVKAGLAAGMHVCHYRGADSPADRYQCFSDMAELEAMLGDLQRELSVR